MSKEEFLSKLRSRLEILDEREVEDIINEYSEHIDEKVKKKITEEEATSEFGDIDELVSGILSAYKVNENFVKKNKGSFVDEFIETTKEVFDKLIKIVSHGTIKEIFYLCIYILVIILILLIVRVPFEILENGIDSIIYSFPDPIFNVFNVFEEIILNIIYLGLSAVIFIKILNEKLLDGVSFVYEEKKEVLENKKKSKKDKVSSSKEDKVIVKKEEHTKIKYKNERTFLDFIGDLLKALIRGFAFLISIPFVISVVCLAICLAFVIIFSIEYKFFLGPILAVIGCLLFTIVVCEILYAFIFKKEIMFRKVFITFVVSLIISGMGVGYSVFEISRLTFKNIEDTQKVLIREDNLEYNNEIINCYECESINVKLDNSLKNDEIKVTVYSYDYHDVIVERDSFEYFSEGNHVIEDSINYMSKVNLTILFDKVKKDLKNNEIYSYDDYAYIDMVIYANENMYNVVKSKIRS